VTSPVELDGGLLSISDLVRAARDRAPVRLSPAAAGRVERAHARLRELAASGAPIYGVTTGVGALERDRSASGSSEEERQRALLRSHAAGVGAPMADDEVRAMMIARASTLAKGMSGVSPGALDRLLALVARGVTPVVPALGSVGASDLAPLAHVGLALIGEGRARFEGSELPAAEALARAGLAPARLSGRDGLALINGLAQSAAVGALAAHDAASLIELAEATAAMTLSALGAPRDFLDERLAEAKAHPGQQASARAMRRLLGDDIRRAAGPLRAPLSLRYAPQVIGAARSALAFATTAIEAELAAAADNPILFDDGSLSSNSASTGGQELAQALDLLAAALASLAVASERRAAALLDGSALPLALRHPRARPGVDSGLLIAQYTAAALVAELRVRGGAASAHSIPTCPGEDHVSMSALAARQARFAADRARTVVAIELLCACQAVDVAGAALAPALGALHARVRERVPVWVEDRFLADDIAGTLAAIP
jgi:histidine ammonia-lyase